MNSLTEEPGSYWLKKEKGKFLERTKEWVKRKNMTKPFLEKLKKIAWKLAEIFDYNTLAKSTTKSSLKRQANEVHAWILLNYPKTYRRLIFDNRVIDLACLYARRHRKLSILNKIKLEDLKDFEGTIIYVDNGKLKNYPMIRFDRIIVFHRKGRTFYDEVAMETNAKIKVNNWDTIGTNIYFDGSLLSFLSDDIPFIVLTKDPKKPDIFYETSFDEQRVTEEKEVMLTKLYHNALTQLATIEKKLDKAQKLAVGYAKIASDAIKEADLAKREDWRIKLQKRDIERKKQNIELEKLASGSRYNLTPIIIVLILVIGFLIGMTLYLNNIPSQTQQIEGATLGLRLLGVI